MDSSLDLLQRLHQATTQASEGEIDTSDGPGREMLYQEILVSCTIAEEDAQTLRKLKPSDISIWRKSVEAGISLASVGTALHAHISQSTTFSARLVAASVYVALVAAPGCPVASLMDEMTWLGVLRVLRQAAVPQGTSAVLQAAGEEDDLMDLTHDDPSDRSTEDPAATSARLLPPLLQDLSTALSPTGPLALRDSPDLHRMILDALALLASASDNPKVLKGCYDCLAALWAPKHGDVKANCTAVFHVLSTAVFVSPQGPPPVKGAKKGSRARALELIRRTAVEFAARSVEAEPRAREAVAALMRHLSLKCCSKADLRSVALHSIRALLPALPEPDRAHFVRFLCKLSRTPTANHRLLSVELASEIILNFEGAFERAAAAATTDKGPAGPDADVEMAEDEGHVAGAGGPRRRRHVDADVDPEVGRVPLPSPGSVKRALTTPTDEAGSDKWPSPSPKEATGEPSPLSEAVRSYSVGILCLYLLVQRCSDKVPNVRAKALSVLGLVVGEISRNVDADVAFTALQQLRHLSLQGQLSSGDGAAAAGGPTTSPLQPDSAQRIDFDGVLLGAESSARKRQLMAEKAALEGIGSLMRLARRRAGDDKGVVRKASLVLLEASLQLARALRSSFSDVRLRAQLDLGPSQEDVEVMVGASMDVLVTVRKAALQALVSAALEFPTHAHLPSALVRALSNLLRDAEASVHDQVAATLADVLLDPLAAASKKQDAEPGPFQLSLRVLGALGANPAAAESLLSKYLPIVRHRKLSNLKQAAAGLTALVLQEAASGVEAGHRVGGWVLLAELAALDASHVDCAAVYAQWERMSSCSASGPQEQEYWSRAAAPLLRAVAALSPVLPAQQSEGIASSLFASLQSLTLPPALVGAYVHALAKLARERTARLALPQWTKAVLEGCEDALSAYVSFLRKGGLDAERAAAKGQEHHQQEHTEPEFSFQLPGAVGKEREKESAEEDANSHAALMRDERSARALCALFTVGEVALLASSQPSARLLTLTQALTVEKLATDAAPSFHAASTVHVAPLVQAYAWTAVGKIGLVNEPLAKKLVPLLVQELGASPHPAVRNNLLVVLADLCVTYTALVDAHMPRLTGCIRDPCEIVRKQALALLARLLSSDYVKCRGPLFHQLCLALTDSSREVVEVAEYVLRETLAVRIPLLAYNHFSESLFILNKCQPSGIEVDPASTQQTQAQQESTAQPTSLAQFESSGGSYPLAGPAPEKRDARRKLYQTLLRFMTQEHRLATAAKISGNVLARVAEGSFSLDSGATEEVFGDALWLLTCPEIRTVLVPPGSGATGGAGKNDKTEEDLEAEAAIAGAVGAGNAEVLAAEAAAKVRGKIVAELARKQLQDGIVPVLSVLRARLLELRHPRLRDVMTTFAALLREYKGDLQDLIPSDRLLVKELQLLIRGEGAAAAGAGNGRDKRAGPAGTAARRPAALKIPGEEAQGAGPRRGGRSTAHPAPLPGVLPDTPLANEVLRESQRQGTGPHSGTGAERGAVGSKTPFLGTARKGAVGGAMAGPTPKKILFTAGPTTGRKGARAKSRIQRGQHAKENVEA